MELSAKPSIPCLEQKELSSSLDTDQDKKKINQVGISYSFFPAPKCFMLFFFFFSLEMERSKKDNCQTWARLKGYICSSRLFAFSRTREKLVVES